MEQWSNTLLYMSKKRQAFNIAMAVVAFALVVGAVAAIGEYTLKKETPDIIQGEVEVSEYRVSGKVPGRIKELRVQEGDYVHVGDILAVIDAPEVDAKMTQATSAESGAAALSDMAQAGAREQQKQAAYQLWQQAKVAEEITGKTLDRVQRLYNEGVMTAQKRDEAEAAHKAAVAQAQAAKSQYDLATEGARREEKAAAQAQVNRAKGAVQEVSAYKHETVQRAQAAGEVSNVYPKLGELVGTGSPIMTIAQMDNAWGTFSIREDQLSGMKIGSRIRVFVPAFNKEIDMEVFHIKDQGTYAVWKATKSNGQYDLKTFEVKARPLGKVEGLRPGMSLVIKK